MLSVSLPSTRSYFCSSIFFFHDPATTEIYTLSLHDALPICHRGARHAPEPGPRVRRQSRDDRRRDRKSTRLNSSHRCISYAVFCLKKKKKTKKKKEIKKQYKSHKYTAQKDKTHT